jgi:hypothetical protein
MISLICRDSLLSCSQPTQSKPYFDDRIKIENPGVLIPGLIEQWGSGIPVILEEAASQHLPPPLFEEVGLRFRVALPLAQASSPAQGQSRPRGAESRAESLLSLRHPSQAVAQIEVLAECCREPIPGMYWLICQYLTSAGPPCSTGFPIKVTHRES